MNTIEPDYQLYIPTSKAVGITFDLFFFDNEFADICGITEHLNTKCDIDTLVGMDLTSPNPLALLYQTGYLTIKYYDDQTQFFTLGVPNREVKEGLAKSLLPHYIAVKRGVT